MFLDEFGPIEAEAFLTLAADMIEEDGVVTEEESAMLDEYTRALGVIGFTYDACATAAARDTLAQLNEVSKRKVYMELYQFAMADGVEAPEERMALNELRDALQLSEEVCEKLELAVNELNAAYVAIDAALTDEEDAEETPAE
ncbi:MAG TPA: hypothetical protein DDX71_06130 [Ruminococcus sp.]|nr:hypothetical protein [Ruminococcus sp.]